MFFRVDAGRMPEKTSRVGRLRFALDGRRGFSNSSVALRNLSGFWMTPFSCPFISFLRGLVSGGWHDSGGNGPARCRAAAVRCQHEPHAGEPSPRATQPPRFIVLCPEGRVSCARFKISGVHLFPPASNRPRKQRARLCTNTRRISGTALPSTLRGH